jgi:hypothetical protein
MSQGSATQTVEESGSEQRTGSAAAFTLTLGCSAAALSRRWPTCCAPAG